ncbi:hypothetical protein AAVH_43246 [Aphelenchoides avenae]|nr:hypothetical protein AAVH_43246 [Aphelenchus avenae]
MIVTIADVAKFFSDLIVKAERIWKRRKEDPDGSARRWQQIKDQKENDGENDQDAEDVLAEAGLLAKMFALMLLLVYLVACAFVFSRIQSNWSFLDSFYFSLITLVLRNLSGK